MNIRKVVVHGANGVQGGAIARQLVQEGFEVRGTVRNPAKSPLAAEIEVVAADLDSLSALRSASTGMDAVVLTLPMNWNRETVLRWARNAALAARDSGVEMLILNSGTRIPDVPTDVPAFEHRRAAEAVVREGGPPSIFLRPPFYLDNLAGPWIASGIVRDRTLAYPLAETLRSCWLATADLGAYVGAALRRPDLTGRTLDIGGPEALDGPALAAELSRTLGHPLRYFAVPPPAFEQGLVPAFGPDVARGIARTYTWLAEHGDTTLLTGAAAELTASLARPLMGATAWAKTQSWTLSGPTTS
jgi:NAD(P)H dehydrogenase (quinone)